MSITCRGATCAKTNPSWRSTQGSTGFNDSADPSHPVLIPRVQGPLGAIKLAEEGEIVLAQMGPGISLPAKTAKTREVILTSKEGGWYRWACQFVAHSRSSRSRLDFERKNLSHKAVQEAYEKAAKLAANGMLIVSVGHGFSWSLKSGAVDLAPGAKWVLSSVHFDARADPQLTLTKEGQELLKTYESIGRSLKKHKVQKVLFMACNVGGSHDFVREIVNDWQLTILAYEKQVGYRRVYTGPRRRVVKYGLFYEGVLPKTKKEELESTYNYPRGENLNKFEPKTKTK